MNAVRDERSRRPITRVAVIGCGAAAREFCLPVLCRSRDMRRSVILVDHSRAQAISVANEFEIEHYCTDYRELPMEIDAAIVTTPHHLHAEQAIHFLRLGIPVFVEKPLGMTSDEATSMLAAADAGGATLMVNNCRRLFPAYRHVQDLLSSQELGAIRKIHISDGSPFEWNSVSDFYLKEASKAKGVLLDRGAHTVDVVCSWLSESPQVVEAHHDSAGGAEALFDLRLRAGQVEIELVFSRLYKLENCYTIECEDASIKGRLFQPAKLEIHRPGHVESVIVGTPMLYPDYARKLLENFLDVVADAAAPLFTAKDVAPSIALIDAAYQKATPFASSWYQNDPNLALLSSKAFPRSLHGKP